MEFKMTQTEARTISGIILHMLKEGSKNPITGDFEVQVGSEVLEIGTTGMAALNTWAERLKKELKQ